MTNRLSSKIEIINHFDNLINRVDIDIEESIGKYSEEQVLSQLRCFEIGKRNVKSLDSISLECFDSDDELEDPVQYQTVDQWPESMKVIDYLNQIRERTINELRKAQEDTLSHYKQSSAHFKSNHDQQIDEKNMDELVFKEKYFFQVLYKPEDPKYAEPWIFNLYTFITDFNMSPSDIELLETLINSSQDEDTEVDENDNGVIFDEKMVLIGLLQKQFFKNLQTEKFPSHMIISRKQDLLNIQEIYCYYDLSGVNLTATSIDLSNLERLNLNGNRIDPIEISIEGLSSLKYLRLDFDIVKQITFRNLPGMREFVFYFLDDSPNNKEFLSRFSSELSEFLPNIETLSLHGELSNLNLEDLVNLKKLTLSGYLMNDFNVDIFKNICNQLEEISIGCSNIDDNSFAKLFYGLNFPYLRELDLASTEITKLEKAFFDRFPMLQTLSVYGNRELRKIDHDAFSNLKHLIELDLMDNCIESIDKSHFSNLTKMDSLVLDGNPLGYINEYVFSDLKNLQYLSLNNIQLTSLGPQFLAGLNNLEILTLNENKLTNFDCGVLDNIGVTRIKVIDLQGNPIINKDITLYPLANGGKVLFKYSEE